ncbi:MAG: 23S rRNA (guanosine(2251)-2'-O)-methyltransferase RlmB [Rickettsiales bacterium]|nr:23S rRNA (guanosine(2251)-2'-O)-methyltransferase RlmB [Rickettsiales bacterium]
MIASKNFKENGCLSNKSLIYGKHPFFSVIKSKKRKIYSLFILEKNKNEFLNFLKDNNLVLPKEIINFVDSGKLDGIFPYQEKNHQGYILYASEKERISFDDFIITAKNQKPLPKLLILDQILDPHNLGAIIRTAVAFGIDNIIITSFNSVKDTPTVVKSSAGLSELINLIEVVNLNNTIKDLKNIGYFIIGLDGEAKLTVEKINDSNNLVLVLGNEGRGIRELVKKNCDDLVKIPMENCVESLNVSVAAAIAIYELWGQNVVD